VTLTIETIDQIDDAETLVGAWNVLAEESSAQPTMTPGFALNWWRHMGKGELTLLIARDAQGDLRAVAPLHQRRLIGIRTVRWLGHGSGVVGHVVAMPDDRLVRAAMWEAITRRFSSAELVDVAKRDWEMLEGLPVLRSDLNRCPTATMEPGWTMEDYLAGGIRKRARRELARTRKRLVDGHATSEIRCGSSWLEVEALMPMVQKIYDAAEAEWPRLHLLAGEHRTFFRSMLKDAADRGRLDVLVVFVNDEPAAFDMMISVGEAGHAVLGRYAPSAREWGLGHLLIEAMAARVLERGLQIFNLQLGDDEYKRAWAEGGEDLVRIVTACHAASKLFDHAVGMRHRAFRQVKSRLG